MSDTIFEEYKEYYRARAARYEGNANYSNTYEAECNLRDAFVNSNGLEEFKSRVGDLNYKCASSLIKDKNLMEQVFFNEYQEIIRVHASNRILEKIDQIHDVKDLVTMVKEEENKCMIEISMDEANRQFHDDWSLLDWIEVYENAVVPDEYLADMRNVDPDKKKISDYIATIEERYSHWQKGWRLNNDVVTEHRHRRLLPYKDEHVEEQLKKYKAITNR